MTKRVIIGAVLEDNAVTLHAFLNRLATLDTDGLQVGFSFIGVHFSELCTTLVSTFLNGHNGFIESDYVQREVLSAVPQAHRRNWHFALGRNRIIQEAIQSKADALLLIDGHTCLNTGTLKELLEHDKPWVDKLVFEGDTALASPTIATPFSEIDGRIFTPPMLMPIATAGMCMLLRAEALTPLMRYQYFPALGLYNPDQHLSLRAMLTQSNRFLDTQNPIHRTHKEPEKGSLVWLCQGVAELLSYTPESTGLEGVSYLCTALREQKEADAAEISAQLRADQLHAMMLPVSIQPHPEAPNKFTIRAVQILKVHDLEEHHSYLIEIETIVEDAVRWISGLDMSQLLPSELPTIKPAQQQRYAVPPLHSAVAKPESKTREKKAMKVTAKQKLSAVSGLQIYRLPH